MYEGRTRRFAVTSVSTQSEADGGADLAASIQSLSLSDAAPPKLWTVGWETTVVLDSESSKTAGPDEPTDNAVSPIHLSSRGTADECMGTMDAGCRACR